MQDAISRSTVQGPRTSTDSSERSGDSDDTRGVSKVFIEAAWFEPECGSRRGASGKGLDARSVSASLTASSGFEGHREGEV